MVTGGDSTKRAGGVPARTTQALWECQVGAIDPDGDLINSRRVIETPDWREAIHRCCSGLDSADIEWVEVRRV